MHTQENRLLAVNTPLGLDELLLTGFRGKEGLSNLFAFELDMISKKHDIAFKDIIGKNVSVSIMLADGNKRYFSGLISGFSQDNGDNTSNHTLYSSYSAIMVPWLWLLTRTTDSRIYQHLSVPDIVEEVFSEYGFTDHSLRLHGSYNPLDYAVQYRESDFNFISRLLEEEGIYYFFEHDEKKHTMVIADSPAEHKPCPKQESARYRKTSGGLENEDIITSAKVRKEIRAGRYTLKDFNFKVPNTDLEVTADSKYQLGPGKREIYDYPGKYTRRNAGDRRTNIRMEEEESRITTINGTGTCRSFASGFRFGLKDHFRDDMNDKEFILTHVEHDADQKGTYRSGAAQGAATDTSYTNSFKCIPFELPFRPLRSTPKPVVKGVQTAIVVGPAGEDIYTDQYGRVKVLFHWDREGKKDENTTCWIRVSQTMAGNRWGAISLPRIGHEVIVDFLEGDPDRPIITGQVYHGNNMPPYSLPGNKTVSTFKSNSSPEGGGFNEIRIEDKKGDEQIFIHAEKNQDIRIKEDRLEWVGQDSHLIITKDQLEKIEGDKHLTVHGDHNEKIGGTLSIKANMDILEKVGSKHALDAGKEIHLKAGMKVVIEAGTQLTIKVGSNFVDIGPAGVTIQGAMVNINSGGSAGTGSGASPGEPALPMEADTAVPGKKATVEPAAPLAADSLPPPSPQAQALKSASKSGLLFCEI